MVFVEKLNIVLVENKMWLNETVGLDETCFH